MRITTGSLIFSQIGRCTTLSMTFAVFPICASNSPRYLVWHDVPVSQTSTLLFSKFYVCHASFVESEHLAFLNVDFLNFEVQSSVDHKNESQFQKACPASYSATQIIIKLITMQPYHDRLTWPISTTNLL